ITADEEKVTETTTVEEEGKEAQVDVKETVRKLPKKKVRKPHIQEITDEEVQRLAVEGPEEATATLEVPVQSKVCDVAEIDNADSDVYSGNFGAVVEFPEEDLSDFESLPDFAQESETVTDVFEEGKPKRIKKRVIRKVKNGIENVSEIVTVSEDGALPRVEVTEYSKQVPDYVPCGASSSTESKAKVSEQVTEIYKDGKKKSVKKTTVSAVAGDNVVVTETVTTSEDGSVPKVEITQRFKKLPVKSDIVVSEETERPDLGESADSVPEESIASVSLDVPLDEVLDDSVDKSEPDQKELLKTKRVKKKRNVQKTESIPKNVLDVDLDEEIQRPILEKYVPTPFVPKKKQIDSNREEKLAGFEKQPIIMTPGCPKKVQIVHVEDVPQLATIKLKKIGPVRREERRSVSLPKFLLKSRIRFISYPPVEHIPVVSVIGARRLVGELSRNAEEALKILKKKRKKVKLPEDDERPELEEYVPFEDEQKPEEPAPQDHVKPPLPLKEKPAQEAPKALIPVVTVIGAKRENGELSRNAEEALKILKKKRKKVKLPEDDERPELEEYVPFEDERKPEEPAPEDEVKPTPTPKDKPAEDAPAEHKLKLKKGSVPQEEDAPEEIKLKKPYDIPREDVDLEKPEKMPYEKPDKEEVPEEKPKPKKPKKEKPQPETLETPIVPGVPKPQPEEETPEIKLKKKQGPPPEIPTEEIKLKPFKKDDEKPVPDAPEAEIKFTPEEKPAVEEDLSIKPVKDKDVKKKRKKSAQPDTPADEIPAEEQPKDDVPQEETTHDVPDEAQPAPKDEPKKIVKKKKKVPKPDEKPEIVLDVDLDEEIERPKLEKYEPTPFVPKKKQVEAEKKEKLKGLQKQPIMRTEVSPKKVQVVSIDEVPQLATIKLKKAAPVKRDDRRSVSLPKFLLKSRINIVPYPPEALIPVVTVIGAKRENGELSRNAEEALKILKKKRKKVKLPEDDERPELEEYVPFENERKPEEPAPEDEVKPTPTPKDKPAEDAPAEHKLKLKKGSVPQEEDAPEEIKLKKVPEKPKSSEDIIEKLPKKSKPPEEDHKKTTEEDDERKPEEPAPEDETKPTPTPKDKPAEDAPVEHKLKLKKGSVPHEEDAPEEIKLRKAPERPEDAEDVDVKLSQKPESPEEVPKKKSEEDDKPAEDAPVEHKLKLKKGLVPEVEDKPEEIKLRKAPERPQDVEDADVKLSKKPESPEEVPKKKSEEDVVELKPFEPYDIPKEDTDLEKPDKMPYEKPEKAVVPGEKPGRKKVSKKKPTPEVEKHPIVPGSPKSVPDTDIPDLNLKSVQGPLPEDKPTDISLTPLVRDEKSPEKTPSTTESLTESVTLKPSFKESEELEVGVVIRPPKPVDEEAVQVTLKKKQPKPAVTDEVADEVTVTKKVPTKPREDLPEDVPMETLTLKSKPLPQEDSVETLKIKPKAEEPLGLEEEGASITIKRKKSKPSVEVAGEVSVKKIVPENGDGGQDIEEMLKVKTKPPKHVDEGVDETNIKLIVPQKSDDTTPESAKLPDTPKTGDVNKEVKLEKPLKSGDEDEVKISLRPAPKPTTDEEVAAVTLKKVLPVPNEDKDEETVTVRKRDKILPEDEVSEEVTIKKTVPEKPAEGNELAESVTLKKKTRKQPQVEEAAEAITIKKPLPEQPEEVETVIFKPKTTKKKEDVEQEFKIQLQQYEEEEISMSGKVRLKKPKPMTFGEEAGVGTIQITQEVDDEGGPVIEEVSDDEGLQPEKIREDFEIKLKRKPSEKRYSIQDIEEEIQVGFRKEKRESVVFEEETLAFKPKPKRRPSESSGLTEDVSLSITKEAEVIKEEAEQVDVVITEVQDGDLLYCICSYVAENDDAMNLVEGERVYVLESHNSDWWFVRKTLTAEKGWVPAKILKDEVSYTHHLTHSLHEKIDKLPVFEKPVLGQSVSAPRFIEKLQPQHAPDGSTVQLECRVEGNPKPQITWFRETAIIKPSPDFQMFYDEDNVATLIIREVFPEDAGFFTCVAKNSVGFASSTTELYIEAPLSDHGSDITAPSRKSMSRESSLADILEGIPPTFSRKPKAKCVPVGEDVDLECRLVAIPEPEVTWLFNGKELTTEKNVTVATDSDMHSYSSIVHISKIRQTQEGTYTVVARNREGEASMTITVKVQTGDKEGPQILEPLRSVTIREGDSAVLSTQIVGNPKPKITWYKDGKAAPKLPTKTDGDTYTLTLIQPKATDSAQYTVKAVNEMGKCETTATLTVEELPRPEAPLFIERFQEQKVKENSTIKLVAKVTGNPTPQITWFRNNEPLLPSNRIKEKFDGSVVTLEITGADSELDAGDYKCLASNPSGKASHGARVTVDVDRVIFTKKLQKSVIVDERSSLNLECETSHTVSTKWYHNGKELSGMDHREIVQENKSHRLQIMHTSLSDCGTYICKVKDQSTECTVSVNEIKAEFVRKVEDIEVKEREIAVLEVEVSSNTADVTWHKDGEQLKEVRDKVVFEKKGAVRRLLIRSTSVHDEGEYTCALGDQECSAEVTVIELPPEIITKLKDTTVAKGDKATLDIELTKGDALVRWFKDGKELQFSEHIQLAIDGKRQKLKIYKAELSDAAVYSCQVGDQTSSARLTVQEPDVTFTMRMPEVIRVPVEADATLTVELSRPDVEVKWFKKSEEIKEMERFTFFSEGNVRKLIIKKVKIEDQSDYSCVMLSAKTSTKLIVEVSQSIPIIEVPKNEYKVRKGNDVSMEVNFISTPPPTDEWSINGTVIKKSKKSIPSLTESAACLTIKKVEEKDVGNYKIKLKNKSGEASADLKLILIEPPGAPGTPDVLEVTNDSITLCWKAPESDGNSPIIEYIIEYHARGEFTWSNACKDTRVTETTHKVTRLVMNSELTFRVVAVNEAGPGEPSPATRFVRIAIACKPSAPRGPFEISSMAESSFTLKWQPPESDGGSPLLEYLLERREVGKKAWQKVGTTSGDVTFIDVPGLKANTPYNFRVTASNIVGNGPSYAPEEPITVGKMISQQTKSRVEVAESEEEEIPTVILPFPKPRFKPSSFPPTRAPRPSLVVSEALSSGVPASLLTPALSSLPTRPLSATPLLSGLSPTGSPRSLSPMPHSVDLEVESHASQRRSTSIDFSVRKVSSGLITFAEGSLEMPSSLPVTSELSPSYLVIENRKDSFASEYEVNRNKAPLGKAIDASKFKNISGEDLRTILTFFPVSGSELTTTKETSEQHNKNHSEKTCTKAKKQWPAGTVSENTTTLGMLKAKPREKLPPRPMVIIHPVKPVVVEERIASPSAPTNLTVIDVTSRSITLQWGPPENLGGTDLTGYIVERQDQESQKWVKIATLDPSCTHYCCENLKEKSEFSFRVLAENVVGLSPPASTDRVCLKTHATPPSPPTAPLEILAVGPYAVVIEWGTPESDGGSPLTGYTIAIRDTRKTMWMEVGRVKADVQKLTIKDLQENHEYLIRIFAVNEVGSSEPLESDEPFKVLKPSELDAADYERGEATDKDTPSVSFSTEPTTSSWMRENNMDADIETYAKGSLLRKDEYFFKVWCYAKKLFKWTCRDLNNPAAMTQVDNIVFPEPYFTSLSLKYVNRLHLLDQHATLPYHAAPDIIYPELCAIM
ncbi:Titin, partial [Frankliniella fusca]